MQKIHEECGVFGVSLTTEEAVGITYNGLLSLQHRGQEGAGIATVHDNNIKCHKDEGLVTEVFGDRLTKMKQSKIAVGHTSYFENAENMRDNSGPFVREYLTGRLVTSFNGNITNVKTIKEQLKNEGLYFKSICDGEVVSALIAYHTSKNKGNIYEGVIASCKQLQGAFSIVVASGDGKIVAIRDPAGYRPLCVGKSDIGVAVSSESCALDVNGFEFLYDLLPGEVVVFENAKITKKQLVLKTLSKEDAKNGLCCFEYVYFARSDSVIDGVGVSISRFNIGAALAKEHPANADYVIGVPDSGLDAAIGYAQASGIPLATGFVKNRYVGRSFIYPTQSQRDGVVKVKLNPLKSIMNGHRVVLVDDSIVRGTTMRRVIARVRDAGAKEVHVRISSPPFMHVCKYGTKIDSEDDLIARKLSVQQICELIGADSLGFVSVEGINKACGDGKIKLCTACFDGYGDNGACKSH